MNKFVARIEKVSGDILFFNPDSRRDCDETLDNKPSIDYVSVHPHCIGGASVPMKFYQRECRRIGQNDYARMFEAWKRICKFYNDDCALLYILPKRKG